MSHRLGDKLRILGSVGLNGTVGVSGSKNAALPMMAAAILADEPVRLQRVPRLVDVEILGRVLGELGIEVERAPGGDLLIETVDSRPTRAGWKLVRRMRAGFCVLGPLLARRGRAIVSLPGGCNIGPRPIDLHLKGLAALGADLKVEHGSVVAKASRLVGTTIDMRGPRGPTVTGTANVLSAAVLARGTTTIRSAAIEPEIVDLGNLLNRMGARISGLGTTTLRVIGVDSLGGASYRVIPDRIEAATLLLGVAITGGTATITGLIPGHLEEVLNSLRSVGAELEVGDDRVRLAARGKLGPVDITARPYPGIGTDVQAQWMALLSLSRGRSTIRDTVFPERFQHVAELNRLGTQIEMSNSAATVTGVGHLSGAQVTASDLRASAALVLAGLAAEGETVVHHVHHLDRGYEQLDEKLRGLGARVERISGRTNLCGEGSGDLQSRGLVHFSAIRRSDGR